MGMPLTLVLDSEFVAAAAKELDASGRSISAHAFRNALTAAHCDLETGKLLPLVVGGEPVCARKSYVPGFYGAKVLMFAEGPGKDYPVPHSLLFDSEATPPAMLERINQELKG